jgi:hypothetical protein
MYCLCELYLLVGRTLLSVITAAFDIDIYTECHRRKGQYFGSVFLMLNYTEKNPKHLYPKLNGLGDNSN